eukprot:TRINITY_DN6749_c0_g1_i1.p2 TRINITY_DN6749_c0_g1~~TRINITY_DN6749_c0_g1_i1.p2  ORF type:complete len:138 (-),score=35.68 TRINITY_DN6749_c0_g1_i1:62-475(-)
MADLQKAKADLEAHQAQIHHLEAELVDLKNQLENSRASAAEYLQRTRELEDQLDDAAESVKEKRREVLSLQEENQNLRDELDGVLRATEGSSGGTPLLARSTGSGDVGEETAALRKKLEETTALRERLTADCARLHK